MRGLKRLLHFERPFITHIMYAYFLPLFLEEECHPEARWILSNLTIDGGVWCLSTSFVAVKFTPCPHICSRAVLPSDFVDHHLLHLVHIDRYQSGTSETTLRSFCAEYVGQFKTHACLMLCRWRILFASVDDTEIILQSLKWVSPSFYLQSRRYLKNMHECKAGVLFQWVTNAQTIIATQSLARTYLQGH